MNQILLIEDDCDLNNIAKIHLSNAGYKIDSAYTCVQAKELISSNKYDLALLDVLLPDGDGMSVCHFLHEKYHCPVIFMSCLDNSQTIISALNEGGDDYLIKPLKYDELLARIAANIRRQENHHTQSKLEHNNKDFRYFNHFTINTLHHKVIKDSKNVELSSIEYSILTYMVDHPDTLLLYDDIYQCVWNHESLGDVRTVMVHISNLRKKIDPDRLGLICTVRNAGYIFSEI